MSGTTTLTKYEPCGVCAERLQVSEAEADRRYAESVESADNVQRIVDDLERELYEIPAYVSDAKVARYAELKRSIIRKQRAGVYGYEGEGYGRLIKITKTR